MICMSLWQKGENTATAATRDMRMNVKWTLLDTHIQEKDQLRLHSFHPGLDDREETEG